MNSRDIAKLSFKWICPLSLCKGAVHGMGWAVKCK